MPFCPKCKYEYRPDVTVCPDCDLKLIAKLHAPEKQEHIDVELVTVADFTFDIQAEEAKALLESHGISAIVENAISSMVYPGMGGIKVSVREEDEKKAREVLKNA